MLRCLLFLLILAAPGVFGYYIPPKSTDWHVAELTLLRFPTAPSPTLSAEQVALGCLRSLQLVDYPVESAGIDRIFPFLTFECRLAVTTALGQDVKNDLDVFRQKALLSPVLQVFMGANAIHLRPATCSPTTASRGEIVSFGVTVHGPTVHAVQHKSGTVRDRVSANGPPVTPMVIRVERQRRPPLQSCWLVREIANVIYAKGGQGWSRDEGV